MIILENNDHISIVFFRCFSVEYALSLFMDFVLMRHQSMRVHGVVIIAVVAQFVDIKTRFGFRINVLYFGLIFEGIPQHTNDSSCSSRKQ